MNITPKPADDSQYSAAACMGTKTERLPDSEIKGKKKKA